MVLVIVSLSKSNCISMFLRLDELGVDASVAVHVGDDPTNDKQGALNAGLESW